MMRMAIWQRIDVEFAREAIVWVKPVFVNIDWENKKILWNKEK